MLHLQSNAEKLMHITSAFLLGYFFWYIMGASSIQQYTLDVPLCFYGLSDAMTIEAPESVSVHLAGKRSVMRACNYATLALHIDTAHLKPGCNKIKINREQLLLPDTVRLIESQPSSIIIVLKEIPEELCNAKTAAC